MHHQPGVSHPRPRSQQPPQDRQQRRLEQQPAPHAGRPQAGRQQHPHLATATVESQAKQQADQDRRRQDEKQAEAQEQPAKVGRSRCRPQPLGLHRLELQPELLRIKRLLQCLTQPTLSRTDHATHATGRPATPRLGCIARGRGVSGFLRHGQRDAE